MAPPVSLTAVHRACVALRGWVCLLATVAAVAGLRPAGLARDDSAMKMAFDLPADDAARSLKRFSARSGLEVLYVSEVAANVRTNAVKGDYTLREAIDRLLAGTKLAAKQAEKDGAMTIVSAAGANRSHPGAETADNSQSSFKKKTKEP